MAKKVFKMMKIKHPTNGGVWNITAKQYNAEKKEWDAKGTATPFDKTVDVKEPAAEKKEETK